MTSQSKLWIVVADGEHARILVPGETAGRYRTERSFDSMTAHKRSADLGSDRPGRAFESATPTRHAITPRHDPHALAMRHFLDEVACQINEAAAQEIFARLVLAVPAHALHDLRSALSADSVARLVGIIQKDLVKVPDGEIGSHLTWDALHSA